MKMLNNDIMEVLTSAINGNIIHIPEDATEAELLAWYEILINI